MPRSDTLGIENAKITYKNFAGVEKPFNQAGDRNFCVILDDPSLVAKLTEDGWNVRIDKPRNEDDEPRYIMSVKVAFDRWPPRVFLVTRRGKTALNEETIGVLDNADIINVDLEIVPYHWNVSGKTGIKAYLKTMYATIEEDRFAQKYEEDVF